MQINEEAVQNSSGKIVESLSGFKLEDIKKKDNNSTILANKNSKDAFINVKEIIELFDSTLSKDVKNINKLFESFNKMDNKLKRNFTK